MVNVICAKWGTLYGPDYVNRLRSMVRRHLTLPHRFVCFTDDSAGLDADIETRPMPVLEARAPERNYGWRKVTLFQRPLSDLAGTTLFLDLDLVIVGSLDGFFDLPGRFCVIHNWTHPERRIGNTSVFRFEAGAHADVLMNLVADPEAMFDRYRNSQTFVSEAIGEDIAWWPEGWCVSFKKHCLPGGLANWVLRPRLPEGARIIVFHGTPKPEDALAGRWPGRWTKHVRATPWVAEHWR